MVMNSKHGEALRTTSAAASGSTDPKVHLSEHLANDRTYLAYLRTAISLISFGVTINRFSLYLIQSDKVSERALSHWNLAEVGRLGLGMVILGLILLVWAAIYFTRVSGAIDRGNYK